MRQRTKVIQLEVIGERTTLHRKCSHVHFVVSVVHGDRYSGHFLKCVLQKELASSLPQYSQVLPLKAYAILCR